MTVYMSQVEYAEHRGISQPRVSKMIRDGKLKGCIKTISGRKKINRDKADTALEENLDRFYNPNPRKKSPTKSEKEQATKTAGTKGMSLADAQKLQAQYKAALLKLEYEEKSGKLVPVVQVEKDFFNLARTTRDAILNIPDRISAELASMTDVHVVSEKLTTELTQALDELSRENWTVGS